MASSSGKKREIEKEFRDLLSSSMGDKGFVVLEGDEVVEGHFHLLLAVKGKIVLGGSTKCRCGDRPIENHRLFGGQFLYGNFSSIQRSNLSDAGAILYAFERELYQSTYVYGDAVLDFIKEYDPLFAYGTKRLVGSYNGFGARIIRDSDEDQLDIRFGPDGWLRKSRIESFVGGASAYVTRLYSHTGHFGRNLVQEDISKAFRIVDSGSLHVDENGNPMVECLPGRFMDCDSFPTSAKRTILTIFKFNSALPIGSTEVIFDGNNGDRTTFAPHSGTQKYFIGMGESGQAANGVAVVDLDNDRHYHLLKWEEAPLNGEGPAGCWQHISSQGEGGAIQLFDKKGEMSDLRVGGSQGGTATLNASFQMIAGYPNHLFGHLGTSSERSARQVAVQDHILESFEISDTPFDGLVCSS